jgi:hypothetical protein
MLTEQELLRLQQTIAQYDQQKDAEQKNLKELNDRVLQLQMENIRLKVKVSLKKIIFFLSRWILRMKKNYTTFHPNQVRIRVIFQSLCYKLFGNSLHQKAKFKYEKN